MVEENETIDFFLSHSWRDDPDIKWDHLTELAETFNRKMGRYPTFWLDKVCIDQDNIEDGLKVLPINVMACKRMLVMCGPSYPKRLWCAWELCTLLSFARQEQTLQRVVLVPMETPEDKDDAVKQVETMKHFDVADAHCYDPNEEARLWRAIHAVGANR